MHHVITQFGHYAKLASKCGALPGGSDLIVRKQDQLYEPEMLVGAFCHILTETVRHFFVLQVSLC